MALHAAMLLSLLGSLALAGVLLSWADRVAGSRLLVGFLFGIAIWIVGNELPAWAGAMAEQPALLMLATAPLTAACYLHFALAFCRVPPRRIGLALAYGAGGVALLVAASVPTGHFEPFAGVSLMAIPNNVGWGISLLWAAMAGLGQGVLARGFIRAQGLDRRRIGAVMASSAWGLVCMTGYGIAALHLPLYPWPLLGLPLYPVILVYGILRYRVLVANAWARRAIVWTLLVGVAGLVAGAAGAVAPFLPIPGAAWSSGVVAAAAVLILGGPARRLAERVIYPGRIVTAADLRAWRAVLSTAQTAEALAHEAAALLSAQVKLAVSVQIGAAIAGPSDPASPRLRCHQGGTGWTSELSGWDAAPPGPLRLAGLFGDVLIEQATRLDELDASRERERERQHQARLAELGALAATVAHDVRNPLNTISMAVAMAPPELRAEVAEQVRRIARLTDDLLQYAKPWDVHPIPADLACCVRTVARSHPGVEIAPALHAPVPALIDPARIDQALGNLVDNATAAGHRVAIDVEQGTQIVRLHVCDDGPGIPADIRDRLFEPFVSRRVGGTGLGLAIVAKIMEGHAGSVTLTERPGWTTCFTLTLLAPQ